MVKIVSLKYLALAGVKNGLLSFKMIKPPIIKAYPMGKVDEDSTASIIISRLKNKNIVKKRPQWWGIFWQTKKLGENLHFTFAGLFFFITY